VTVKHANVWNAYVTLSLRSMFVVMGGIKFAVRMSVILFVCSGRISSETAGQIWRKLCRRMEVCMGTASLSLAANPCGLQIPRGMGLTLDLSESYLTVVISKNDKLKVFYINEDFTPAH